MPDHSNDQGNAGRAAIDRLHCPSCRVDFSVPKELDKFKGKRSKCQACGTPIRFSADGLSLTIVDEPSSSKPATAPASASDRVPTAEPVKPAGLLGDALPDIDLGEDRPRQVEPAPKRSKVPLAIAGVALLAVVPVLWMVLGSSKKEGTIQVELQSPASKVVVSIDGKPVDLEQLKAPLTLAVGPHRLEASGKGLVAFQGTLPVFEGTNPPFPVKLSAVPRKPEAPKPESAEEVAAAKAELQPEAASDAKPAEGAAEVVGGMPAEKVEADPAVVGGMPAEKVEADPAVVGDMPAEKVEADPSILGPEPKAGPKSNASLKQIASDPESYLDSSVIASDLILIDTGVVGGPAGKRPGPLDLHLVVKSREGAYRDFVKPGTSFEILLTNEAAAAIRDQVRSGNLVGGDYPAIVKFKMTKGPKGFVGLVESIELLVYVDPRPIFNGKTLYNKVFTVIRVTDGGAQTGLSRSYLEWQKRLASTSVLIKLKNAYRQAFTINRGLEFDRLAELARTKLPANSKMLHENLMNLLRGH
jgi:hypothetical protein